MKALVCVQNKCQLQLGLIWWIRGESSRVSDIVTYVKLKLVCDFLNEMQIKKIPSKLEVAPNALKMLDGVGEWMDGYPLDCYDY